MFLRVFHVFMEAPLWDGVCTLVRLWTWRLQMSTLHEMVYPGQGISLGCNYKFVQFLT